MPADRAAVSIRAVSELERGRKEASSEVLAAICAALGWTIVDLLDAVRVELVGAPLQPLADVEIVGVASSVAGFGRELASGASLASSMAGPVAAPSFQAQLAA